MTAAFPTRIGYDEALAIIAGVAAARRLPPQRMPLSRAHGHVLAADLAATIAQPAFDNAAMDGFALRHADLAVKGTTVLRLLGEQFAGGPAAPAVEPGGCVGLAALQLLTMQHPCDG
jgi:molybdopterin molybdotransferase